MKKAMLIWNPAAGRVGVEKEVRAAARAWGAAGWDVRFERSESAEHITTLAQEAAREAFDSVWVAGGDGSLGRAATGLIGSTTALGILPTGTANVWAQEIGLSVSGLNRVTENARRLTTGEVRTMDIGMCNGRPFLLWAGFGLDGRVVDRLERHRTRWVKRLNELFYVLNIFRSAAGWKGTHMQIETEGQQVEGRFMLAVASNISYYAGGIARLSPTAAWDDGQMEVWLFGGGIGGVRMITRHLWNLGLGWHVKDKETLCLPFRRLKMNFEADEWMQMDGEPWGTVKEVEIEVEAKALRVLLPSPSR